MAITHYCAKTGEPVVFVHPIDAIEQLKAGLVVATKGGKVAAKKETPAPALKAEEPVVEAPAVVTEEPASEPAEVVEPAPEVKPAARKAPRRRASAE